MRALLAVLLLAATAARAEPALPRIALGAEQTVLTKPRIIALGMPREIFSDSTLSLIRHGASETLYGTAADSATDRCDGLIGIPATTVADIDHPETLPGFSHVTTRVIHAGCLAASPHTPGLAAFQTRACQTNPTCEAQTPFDNDYTAMTSVIRLTNGWLAAFVHGENDFWNAPGKLRGHGFYARIGLYISKDDGQTFQRYSTRPVIEGNIRFATVYALGRNAAYDSSGGAALLTADNNVRVYYSDEYDPLKPGDPDQSLADACGVCIAAAQIPLADLTADIVANRIPKLKKYYRGGFTQPARGGRFSAIISPERAIHPSSRTSEYWIVWPSVARATDSNLFVAAYMSEWGGIRMRTSPDGLTHWSEGEFIAPHRASDSPGQPIPATPYPTIIAAGPNFHDIAGDAFYLYYQSAAWPGTFDWSASRIMRRRVTLNPNAYASYAGYFSYTAGYIGYSNGHLHACTIADRGALAALGADPAIAATVPHIEPTEEPWIIDGPCHG